jgi:hypothetical protein
VLQSADEARIYCAGGAVTYAATRADVSLADVLVAARFLEADDWAEAAATDDPATSVAKALAARGADPVRLAAVLQGRTEEAVFELDLWRHGTFTFEPGADHLLGDAFRFAIDDVLTAVHERRQRWDGLVDRFGSLHHVVAPEAASDLAGADDEVVLNRTQFRVLGAAARHLPVAELARQLDLGLFATGELVVGLIDQGLLSVHDPSTPSLPPPPPLPAQAPPPSPHQGAPSVNGGISFDHHQVAPIADLEVPVLEPVGAMAGFGPVAVNGNGHSYANANGNGHGHATDGHANGTPVDGSPLAPNGAEFVAPGDAPARDLILRLLTAVKEL